MKKHIPNLFTSLNLLCGCLAILFVVSGDLVIASLLVIIGMFFDFFDGLAARLLHVQSEIGKQLDSLADMVSFGVVPGLVMFQLLSRLSEEIHRILLYSSLVYHIVIVGWLSKECGCHKTSR